MTVLRYWDSSAFIAWLLPEPDRAPHCRQVIRAAENGEILIVTSALTLTEVIKLKGHAAVTPENERKIRAFFLNKYISVRNLDRTVAEQARQVVWRHNCPPKDSIHVATAIRYRIPFLDTFDYDDLVPLNGMVGDPAIKIGPPSLPQLAIAFDEATETAGAAPVNEPEKPDKSPKS